MSNIYSSYLILTILIIFTSCESKTNKVDNNSWEDSTIKFQSDKLKKINNQIRKEKFDLIIPSAMRKHKIDMWIHVMRDALPDLNIQEDDLFGAEDLGSTSGIFVFTDRGGERIERAVIGRRWGATQRQYEKDESHLINKLGIYDIIHNPIFVTEPLATTETEYDFRFKGLRKFVEERDPKRIAVNYRDELGPWETTRIIRDGISHTDYRLLTKELGKKYSTRLVSSEYVIMDYCISPVPSEVELLKNMRKNELKLVDKAFSEIKPGVTKVENLENMSGDYEVDIVAFRRMYTGESQRGRSSGWENEIVQGKISRYTSGLFLNLTDVKNSDYWAVWFSGINIFFQNPLTGIGPAYMAEICDSVKNVINQNISCQNHPHNYYIQMLAETGFVGPFALLYFAYSISKFYNKSSYK